MAEEDIKHTLGVVVGKLDMLLENQKSNTERLTHIEQRVGSLESYRGYLMGGIAACALLCTIVVEWIKTKIGG
jgi:hypothetical protein